MWVPDRHRGFEFLSLALIAHTVSSLTSQSNDNFLSDADLLGGGLNSLKVSEDCKTLTTRPTGKTHLSEYRLKETCCRLLESKLTRIISHVSRGS
ncbi:hypothetical protein Mapa_007245 [Marchantia paleacea]|nr:hypothetical protein Mapa_007245 [Marchantia paleacea]